MSWLFTPPFLVLFIGVLVGFQLPLMFARQLGYRPFTFIFNIFNSSILWALRVAGTRFAVRGRERLPARGPLIIVSNHQSMYDVPFLIWTLRRFHPKFVAKVELGRWIPSISYCLRRMGSVLIDRGSPRTAIPRIGAWGEELAKAGWSACIFPEGTRARDGMMKPFKVSGLVKLMEAMPEASVLPVAIDNSWRLLEHKLMPLPYGTHVSMTILDPMSRDRPAAEIVEECERRIRECVNHERSLRGEEVRVREAAAS